MHHPTDRIAHTTAFVTPVVEHWLEREIAQWVHPMKDRSDDPSHHERTLLPRVTSRSSMLTVSAMLTSSVSVYERPCVWLVVSRIPFQPVVHNWFIKGHGMYCSVYGKVHIKDPLLLIEKSSLCGGSGFPSKKCVNVTI